MDRIRSAHTSSFGSATWGTALSRGMSMGGLNYARDTDLTGLGRDDDGGGFVFRPDQIDEEQQLPGPATGNLPRARLSRKGRHRQTPSLTSNQEWSSSMDGLRRKNSVLEEEGDGEHYSIVDEHESTLHDDGEEFTPIETQSEEETSSIASSNKLWKFGARGGYSGKF